MSQGGAAVLSSEINFPKMEDLIHHLRAVLSVSVAKRFPDILSMKELVTAAE